MRYSKHWMGGVRTKWRVCLSGWPCCCSGDKADEIRKNPDRITWVRSKVTCKACLALLRREIKIDFEKRSGLELAGNTNVDSLTLVNSNGTTIRKSKE